MIFPKNFFGNSQKLIFTNHTLSNTHFPLFQMNAQNIQTILRELTAAAGFDTVREACVAFANSSPSTMTATPPKKVKKERKPRGPSDWNKFVAEVRAEMLQTRQEDDENAKVSYKEAFEEASRRRRENDPEKQAKYEAYRAAVEEKQRGKTATTEAPPPTQVVVEEEKEEEDDEEYIPKPKICPMCDDSVPAPRGAIAGGDGSHRSCIAKGFRTHAWSSTAEWEEACVAEAETRAAIAKAEEATLAAARTAVETKKPRGRPAKAKATNA